MRRLGRAALGLLFAVGVAAVGLWAGASGADDQTPPPKSGIAAPPNATGEPIHLGDTLRVDGAPMEIDVAIVSDPPQQVATWYAKEWKALGLKAVIAGSGNLWHASVFDPGDGLQRSVTAIGQPDGQTLVMPTLTTPRHPVDPLHGARRSPVPVPPNARAYLDSEAVDSGVRGYSAQFLSPQTANEIVGFYARELPAKGWELIARDTPAKGSDPWSASFRKGPAHLEVQAAPLERLSPEGRGTAVFLTVDDPGGL